MDFFSVSIFHKIFIIFYSLLMIYCLYFDFKEKNEMENRVRDKIDNDFKTEIILEIDEEEKYMLRSLVYQYGYRSMEEFIISILDNEINETKERIIY